MDYVVTVTNGRRYKSYRSDNSNSLQHLIDNDIHTFARCYVTDNTGLWVSACAYDPEIGITHMVDYIATKNRLRESFNAAFSGRCKIRRSLSDPHHAISMYLHNIQIGITPDVDPIIVTASVQIDAGSNGHMHFADDATGSNWHVIPFVEIIGNDDEILYLNDVRKWLAEHFEENIVYFG